MVHVLTRIGASVVTAPVLGGHRMAGILERVLLAGDVGGLLWRRRPVADVATAARGEVHRVTAVHSGRQIAVSTGLRVRRRAVEHGGLRCITMASAAEQPVAMSPAPGRLLTEDRLLGPVAGAGLLAERAGLPAVPAVDLLLVLLGPVTRAGLLAERAGLPAVPAVDLLLVLLGPVTGPACSLNAPVCPPCPPSTCCSFCSVP